MTASRAVRIGLTGPIGCGKSTVAGWLANDGAYVIDADVIARQVTEPGAAALEALAKRFGSKVVAAGVLDRAALARTVFDDPAALRDLEAIVHPEVRARILTAIDTAEGAGAPVVAIEAIRLVEGGLAALCDEIWLIACNPVVQRERLAGRGVEEADAERRIAAQADLVAHARPVATRVIDTDGSLSRVRRAVNAGLRAALQQRY
jgi:dephospho-CoA kinase